MRKIVTISLPEHTAKRVNRIVAQEGYTSTSELFRDLLRAWDARASSPFLKTGGIRGQFHIDGFIKAVKTHANRGAIKTLSRDHDKYLYGE